MQNKEGKSEEIMMYMDGESITLNSMLQEEDIRQSFTQNEITFMKMCSSCTHFQQAWDVSILFRNVKRAIRKLIMSRKSVVNETISHHFYNQMTEYHRQFSDHPISAKQQKMILYGLSLLTYVLKNTDSFTTDKVSRGFERTGQHKVMSLFQKL